MFVSEVSANREQNKVEQTAAFRELVRRKRAFIVPIIVAFSAFYFLLPVLFSYTTVLNVQIIGAVNLAYVYAFALFVATWAICHLYVRQASKWDELAERAHRDAATEKGESRWT